MSSALELSQVVLLSSVAVGVIIMFLSLSVAITLLIQSTTQLVSTIVLFTGELTAALISAIISAITLSLTVVLSVVVAAFLYPASFICARICVSAGVSVSAVILSAETVICMASLSIERNVVTAVVSSGAMAVAFAACLAVGVMSLVESERKAGLGIASISDAVRRNQYRLLELLLNLQSNIEESDLNAALVCTIKCGYVHCARVLLDAGASPNAIDIQGNTVLCLACDTAREDIVQLLLDARARRNTPSGPSLTTALHQSARWGYIECINLLLNGEVFINQRDICHKTPLIQACIHTQHPNKVIQLLIDHGADVNMTDNDDRTAIHHAASRELNLQSLLEAGCNAHQHDKNGDTPLHHACMSLGTPMREDITYNTTTLQQLLHYGCDPNVLNHENNTPIHLAAISGYTKGVNMLLNYNANPNIPNTLGYLAIGYAASRGHIQIVCALVLTNCPLGPCALNGQQMDVSNPLVFALNNHHLPSAHVLVWAGCNTSTLHSWVMSMGDKYLEISANYICSMWLRHHVSHVTSLQHLTRLAIRRCMSIKLSVHITQLPIPIALQDYVMMNDLCQECIAHIAEGGTLQM